MDGVNDGDGGVDAEGARSVKAGVEGDRGVEVKVGTGGGGWAEEEESGDGGEV